MCSTTINKIKTQNENLKLWFGCIEKTGEW